MAPAARRERWRAVQRLEPHRNKKTHESSFLLPSPTEEEYITILEHLEFRLLSALTRTAGNLLTSLSQTWGWNASHTLSI